MVNHILPAMAPPLLTLTTVRVGSSFEHKENSKTKGAKIENRVENTKWKTIATRARTVSHGKNAWSSVLENEVLVSKLVPCIVMIA